jgi:hypothetical protein
VLAWSISLDAQAHERGMRAPLCESYEEDEDGFTPSPVTVSPAKYLAADLEFGFDHYANGEWTFACVVHEDDAFDADLEHIADGLAGLAETAEGIVLCVESRKLSGAWIIEAGVAREVWPTPKLVFAPAPSVEGYEVAIRTAHDACVAVPRYTLAEATEALRRLLAKGHRGLALVATPEPFSYRFAEPPGLELQLVFRGRYVVPILRYRRDERTEERVLEEEKIPWGHMKTLRASFLDESVGEALPFFLLDLGVTLPLASWRAMFAEDRRQISRVVESRHAPPELIQACADFVLSGVYTDFVRTTLIALVSHPNSPVELAQSLSSHSSRSIQAACVDRLSRGKSGVGPA